MMFLALDTMDVETWIILEACLYTGCEIKKKKNGKRLRVEKGVSSVPYEVRRGLSLENIGKKTAEARVQGAITGCVYMESLGKP